MAKRRFRSCFIVDVSFGDTEVVLTDSTRCRYVVRLNQREVAEQLKSWLESTFLKGIAQQLTVFEYADVGNAPDIELQIVRFCNSPKTGKPESVQING